MAKAKKAHLPSLVIAFSSLGWHGLVRAEWLGALRAAAATSSEERSASKRPNFDVAHCLDTARSWFTTDPISGEYDDGQWWNAKLAELCMEYDEVSLVGESMGATAALRFASHATASGSVIALVPQVDLRDFECCARLDFDDEGEDSAARCHRRRVRHDTHGGYGARGTRHGRPSSTQSRAGARRFV